MNRWGAFVAILLLLGGAVVVALLVQLGAERRELRQNTATDNDLLTAETRALGQALDCPASFFATGRLLRDALADLRQQCVPKLKARAADAEHALRVVADEFGCPVTAAAPALMVSCLKSKGWKWRAKAIKFKTRWEAWVAQERAYFAALMREGLVPMTTHVSADAAP